MLNRLLIKNLIGQIANDLNSLGGGGVKLKSIFRRSLPVPQAIAAIARSRVAYPAYRAALFA